jgi:hypothetical protein
MLGFFPFGKLRVRAQVRMTAGNCNGKDKGNSNSRSLRDDKENKQQQLKRDDNKRTSNSN